MGLHLTFRLRRGTSAFRCRTGGAAVRIVWFTCFAESGRGGRSPGTRASRRYRPWKMGVPRNLPKLSRNPALMGLLPSARFLCTQAAFPNPFGTLSRCRRIVNSEIRHAFCVPKRRSRAPLARFFRAQSPGWVALPTRSGFPCRRTLYTSTLEVPDG